MSLSAILNRAADVYASEMTVIEARNDTLLYY